MFGLLVRAETFRDSFDAPAKILPTLSALSAGSGSRLTANEDVSWAFACSTHIRTPRRAIENE